MVQFKIKRHTPLSKLMKAYCERQVRLWAGCDSTATARPGCSGLHCPGSVCLHMYAVCVCVCLHVCMHSCACVPCVCVYKSVHVPWSSSLFSPLNLQVVPISSCPSALASAGRTEGCLSPTGAECDGASAVGSSAYAALPWRVQNGGVCAVPMLLHVVAGTCFGDTAFITVYFYFIYFFIVFAATDVPCFPFSSPPHQFRFHKMLDSLYLPVFKIKSQLTCIFPQ